LKQLGFGSDGCVYLVLDPGLQKKFVIKEIDYIEKPKTAMREIPILYQNINNNHIIHYFSLFTENSKQYILMEYCEGGNLDEYISHHDKIMEKV
jgi:serine/threonine protein kinase